MSTDQEFVSRLRVAESRTRMNEKELNNIDDKVTSLKKKRFEISQQISELKVAPRKIDREALWASFEL